MPALRRREDRRRDRRWVWLVLLLAGLLAAALAIMQAGR